MIYIMLYKEESKGLGGPRRYLQDGPCAITCTSLSSKTAQVPILPLDYCDCISVATIELFIETTVDTGTFEETCL